MDMTAQVDFSQFHELAEMFKGEIPLKQICKQEGVSYHAYWRWRSRMGISLRQNHKTPTDPKRVMVSDKRSIPAGLVEVEVEGLVLEESRVAKAAMVHIAFENGLTFERRGMDVDALIEFLTKIRGALCLG